MWNTSTPTIRDPVIEYALFSAKTAEKNANRAYANANSSKFVTALILSATTFNSYAEIPIQNTCLAPQYEDCTKQNILDNHLSENNLWTTFNSSRTNDKNVMATSIADKISAVKIALGLPNKDIAEIYKVARQSLHNYQKYSDVEHNVKQQTRERSIILDDIIQEIRPLFKRSPGAMAKNFTYNGESLLSLLSQEELNKAKIFKLASLLTERMQKNSKNSDRLTNGLTLNDLTRST